MRGPIGVTNMTGEIKSVGFIGLGDMGSKQAREIAKLPLALTVFDVRPEAMSLFEGKATLASSIAELGCTSELVGICVQTAEQVNACIEELLPAMKTGSVILIHATVSPSTVTTIAARAKELGIEVRDAPVTRTRMTEDGPFVFCAVGGDETVKVRVQPILDAFATDTLLVGPVGSAMALKICNNLVSWCEVAVGLEAVKLAEAAGVSPDVLLKLMGTNGILTPPMKIFAGLYAAREGAQKASWIANVAGQGEKDLQLAIQLARRHDAPLPLASFASTVIKEAVLGVTRTQRPTKPMETLFGNTLVVKSARGSARLWYDADGTFTGVDNEGTRLGGTWTIDGVTLCTTILQPGPRLEHRGTLEPHKVGDTWEDHRSDGTTTRLTIEPGR